MCRSTFGATVRSQCILLLGRLTLSRRTARPSFSLPAGTSFRSSHEGLFLPAWPGYQVTWAGRAMSLRTKLLKQPESRTPPNCLNAFSSCSGILASPGCGTNSTLRKPSLPTRPCSTNHMSSRIQCRRPASRNRQKYAPAKVQAALLSSSRRSMHCPHPVSACQRCSAGPGQPCQCLPGSGNRQLQHQHSRASCSAGPAPLASLPCSTAATVPKQVVSQRRCVDTRPRAQGSQATDPSPCRAQPPSC